MFELKVNVSYNTNSFIASNVAQTYIQIIPTGLAVFAFENGVSNLFIGSIQEIRLQPSIYTLDLDSKIIPDKLNFSFFCKTVNLSESNSAVNSQIDLMTYKNNPNLVMNRNFSCFGTSSKKNFFFL